MAVSIDSVYSSIVASLGYSNLKNEQYTVINNFMLGDIYQLFTKEIEALHNTTIHLHKCAMLDRPDPFIF